ncbi:50S ribosomal protein L1 [Candidatus Woesearchaeota archaeon]|nr:50S ribosomal protein L1 [Candidatus Woesearchaeota archaeon]
MNKTELSKTLKDLKDNSKERNFVQSVELIVNLKDIDFKKVEQHVDFFTDLPNERGRKVTVCAFVGPELLEEAKKTCDKTIMVDEFDKLAKDKKAVKQLATDYDYFIAQANIMAQVAQKFGAILGRKGKMPNPKAGCVVPPKTNLQPLVDRLQKMVRITAKTQPVIQSKVGSMAMDEEKIINNTISLYDSITHHLPMEDKNIKNAYLKLTMSKPVKIK